MSIKLRISITKEVLEATKDCKEGFSQNCAIAYAIRIIWHESFVGRYAIGNSKWNKSILHGQKKFIEDFDSATPAERAAMQPFSFDIEVPDEVIGEVNIEDIRRICEGSKTLELVN